MSLRDKLLNFLYTHRGFIKDPCRLPRHVEKKRQEVRHWAEEEILPVVEELDRRAKEEFPWEIVRKGAEIGLLTDLIPRTFGGGGRLLDFFRHGTLHGALIIEELSKVCPGVAVIFGAHMLGLLPILLSMDFKAGRRFLSRVTDAARSGKPELCAFAITEPAAGSDAEDTHGARRAKLLTYAKKKDGYYVLNGRKCFISNGSVASIITVFAATDKEKGIDSWTCFVVERGMKGFSVGRIEDKMGQRASPAAELIFEDVKVPSANRVGREGEGWKLNLLTLDTSRPPVGFIALGAAQHAVRKGLEYAEKEGLLRDRHVQHIFADMLMKIEAARTVVWRACSTFPPVSWLSATAKCFASDVAMDVCSRVVDFMGDEGVKVGNEVEKAFRDVKLTQIYEGTNQIQRLSFAEDYPGLNRKNKPFRVF